MPEKSQKSEKIEQKSVPQTTEVKPKSEKIEQKSVPQTTEVKPKSEKIEQKSVPQTTEVKPKSEKIEQKSEEKPKRKYVKKGFNKNSLKNLGKKSTDKTKSEKIEQKSGVSLPQNSNNLIYFGVGIGIIITITGIYFLIKKLNSKKTKKSEVTENETSEEIETPQLSEEDLIKLQKIAEAEKNFIED